MAGKPGRPVFHPGIGFDLRALRESKRWSVEHVVDRAADKGHAALTENRLRWIEAGLAEHPDPDVLRAIAAVYNLDYAPLVWRFVEATYGVGPNLPAGLSFDQLQATATRQTQGTALEALRTAVLASLDTFQLALSTGPETTRRDAPGRVPTAGAHTRPAGARRRPSRP